jgi:hypothetical protein
MVTSVISDFQARRRAGGVELGKKLALGIDLSGKQAPSGHGAEGLRAQIAYVSSQRRPTTSLTSAFADNSRQSPHFFWLISILRGWITVLPTK